jgi:hypothetical protein
LTLLSLLDKLLAAVPVAPPREEVMLAALLSILEMAPEFLERMLLTAEVASERIEEARVPAAPVLMLMTGLVWAATRAPREATRTY